MIMVVLFTVSIAQFRTSTNTCTTEKSIFKLNVRERVQNLEPDSTIKDINASALCQEAYLYDYIWLHQLWIPGGYNYKQVNGDVQFTNDYTDLQSIKEYMIDSQIGSLTDLYYLQNNVKNFCPHMKFLGEFSFYISEDSYLIQNISRFLRRPPTDNLHVYNYRYDKNDFTWALNDQMKTIPYAVPWNYFDPIVMNDMKDIIYRVIIDQHKLDGIVFLQPSLGLYNTMIQFFQPEVSYFGIQQYLQDFYQNFGLKLNQQTLFFMGGEDNLNTKIIPQNYLQLIYGNASPKVWTSMNYTFTTVDPNINKIDPKTVKANASVSYGQASNEYLQSNPTCIIYYITNENGLQFGIQNTQTNKYLLATSGVLFYDSDSLLDNSQCFGYGNNDMIEFKYDPTSEQFIIMKFRTDYTNYQYNQKQIIIIKNYSYR